MIGTSAAIGCFGRMPHSDLPIPLPRDLLQLAIEKAGGIVPLNDRERVEMAPGVVCDALREYIAARTAPVEDVKPEKAKKRKG